MSISAGQTDLWEIERRLRAEGYLHICGIDEAGRGPLAGPVYAAAVILPFGVRMPGLNDSKKLSESVRERLYNEITSVALAFAVASANHEEVDKLNILNATFLAMARATDELKQKPDIYLVDGNRGPGLDVRCICITGGDGKSASIAAASILAKVSRDRYMTGLARMYPQYGFEKHKGYGTKMHYEMLRKFGPSEIHRSTFRLTDKRE